MLWDQSLLELFRKGGFAMWPLLGCSILGIAIVIERSVYFARLRLPYGRFLRNLKAHLERGQIRQAISFCLTQANPVPHIAAEYLKHLEQDALRGEVLKKTGSYALEKIEARLRILAALTHIAPLLGLLGTVTGLVSAFHRIEVMGGQVQPGDLAAGIWEALVTTVFGLVIAIPCMAAYHGFEGGSRPHRAADAAHHRGVERILRQGLARAVRRRGYGADGNRTAGDGVMEFIRPKRASLSLDMAPLIDVVFQSLIFFMLSSSFLTPMLRLTLPKASTRDEQQAQRVVVSVDKAGQVFLNAQPVSLEALRGELERRLGADPVQAVHLRGDEAMSYKLFVQVMDIARQAGARQINILHQGAQP